MMQIPMTLQFGLECQEPHACGIDRNEAPAGPEPLHKFKFTFNSTFAQYDSMS